MSNGVRTFSYRGWEIVRATTAPLEIDVLPGKGGDILAFRWLPSGVNLLWTSPWGLRERNAASAATDSAGRFLETYPGGWQTIFPNGGEPSIEDGVEWGFHGEACLVPWELDVEEASSSRTILRLRTRLSIAPFAMERILELDSGELLVTETAQNEGPGDVEAMWSHHPAFGAPFLSGACRVECEASQFVADGERDVPAGDLEPGAVSPWPFAQMRDGGAVDLRVLPAADERADRFGYISGFERGFAAITNRDLRLRAEMRWDTSIFPHAWYWLEAHATQGPPWHGRAYVFALEPASSYPGHGAAAVRKAGGTLVRFAGGELKTATLSLRVVEI